MLIIILYIYIELSLQSGMSILSFDLLNILGNIHRAGVISPTLQMRKLVTERLSHLPYTTQVIVEEVGLHLLTCPPSSKTSMSVLYWG